MTPQDLKDLIPLYALGALEPDEAATVERAIAADPTLAAELAAYQDAAHSLAAASPPVTPSPDVKARLLASAGGGRFETFTARFGKLFDVTLDGARELLGMIERSASWETPIPGIGVVHFAGGPACATADCGFIRITAGCTFPWHTHRREEVTVVLAGTLRDHEGRIYRAGDELVQPAGSGHEISATADADVIFAARAFDGIELGPRP